jgi:tetratricopeptide (TPR) repeat protein
LPLEFFQDTFLTASEASEVSKLFQCQKFSKETVLFEEEASPAAFYIVKFGKVELQRNDGGRSRLVDLLVQGDFFGEMALLEGKGLLATAVVSEDSELYFITREAFEGLTKSHPSLAAKILVCIGQKLDSPDRMEAFDFDEDAYALNRTIIVSAPVAGCGRTFFGANFARLLAENYGSHTPNTVGVLDLDFPFATTHLYFGCEQGRGWGNYLLDIERAGDVPHIEDYCISAAKGVSLLFPPREEFINDIQKGDIYLLVKKMREAFGIVVVIAPAGVGTVAQSALDCADLTLVVSPFTIDALSRLKTFSRFLSTRPGYPEAFPVVLNRFGSTCDVRTRERDVVPLSVIGRIPNSPLPPKSLKEGELLVDSRPKSVLAKAIGAIVAQVTGRDSSAVSKDIAWLSAWFPFASVKSLKPASLFPVKENVEISSSFFRRKRGLSRLALGEALFIDGQYFKAFQELRRAVDDDPHLARAYSLLGEIAISLGRKQESIDYFGAALRYDSEDYKAMAYFSLLKGDESLLKEAVKSILNAIVEHPQWADLYAWLGLVQLVLESAEAGRRSFLKALSINKRFSTAHYGMALGFEKEGAYVRAIESYGQAIMYRQGNLEAQFGLASLYRSLKLPGLASARLKELVKRCPHHSLAQEGLLELQKELSSIDLEIGNLEAALKIHPGFSDNLLKLGELYQSQGNFDQAVSCFKRTLLANPDFLVAKERLLRLNAIRRGMVSERI